MTNPTSPETNNTNDFPPPDLVPDSPGILASFPAVIFLAAIAVLLLATLGVCLGAAAIFGGSPLPDYPNKTGTANFTPAGKEYVERLFRDQGNTSDSRKALLTNDSPDQVLNYFREKLTKEGWRLETEGYLNGIHASSFLRGQLTLFVVADEGKLGLVGNAGNATFIILTVG